MKKFLSLLPKFAKSASKGLFFKVSLPVVAIVALTALSVWGTVSAVRRQPEYFGLLKGPEILKQEQKDLIKEVGKLISLPEGETPTIATVNEKDKLSGQSFFQKAENGDKLIVYADAKKIILYRPSKKTIVEVGVLNINEGQTAGLTEENVEATPEPSPNPSPTPKPEESTQ